MDLRCESTPLKKGVSEDVVAAAFQDDDARGSYIILSEADEIFIQAAGSDDGPYTLEYRDGDESKHFVCASELTRDEVQTAFLKYLRRDASWKTDFEWGPL